MNRQQRRAAERRGARGHELAGFQPFLTYDELAILEEALALWIPQTREDWEEPPPRVRWSLERGERMRQAFSAALENRPWHDIAPVRERPASS